MESTFFGSQDSSIDLVLFVDRFDFGHHFIVTVFYSEVDESLSSRYYLSHGYHGILGRWSHTFCTKSLRNPDAAVYTRVEGGGSSIWIREINVKLVILSLSLELLKEGRGMS